MSQIVATKINNWNQKELADFCKADSTQIGEHTPNTSTYLYCLSSWEM